MALILSICTGTIVTLALLVYASFLAGRWFFVPRFPDEVCYTTTEDGWRIGVTRFRPPERRHAVQILLVHWIASNGRNYDLTDQLTLAKTHCRAGFDTWVLDLRGRGQSVRPRLFSGLHYDWSFDEYAEKDLPAAIKEVLRATGAAQVHLVGFSIGALVCYAYLSRAGTTGTLPVKSLVSLAGPTNFKRLDKFLSARLIRSLRWLRHRWLMRVFAPGSGYLHPSPLQLIYNPENTDGATQRRAMINAVANFSRNELLQYADWIKNDTFRSIDHRRDYRTELGRIEVPTLFLAGARDPFAAPDAVKETVDACTGMPLKEFRICSRAQGMRVNYGHFDLLLGRNAPEEVYPLVEAWLVKMEDGIAKAPSVEAEGAGKEKNEDVGLSASS